MPTSGVIPILGGWPVGGLERFGLLLATPPQKNNSKIPFGRAVIKITDQPLRRAQKNVTIICDKKTTTIM